MSFYQRSVPDPSSSSIHVIHLFHVRPAAHRWLQTILPAFWINRSIYIHLPFVIPFPILGQLELFLDNTFIIFLQVKKTVDFRTLFKVYYRYNLHSQPIKKASYQRVHQPSWSQASSDDSAHRPPPWKYFYQSHCQKSSLTLDLCSSRPSTPSPVAAESSLYPTPEFRINRRTSAVTGHHSPTVGMSN